MQLFGFVLSMVTSVLLFAANVSDMDMGFSELVMDSSIVTPSDLVWKLVKLYGQDLMLQFYKLFLNLEMIGNPLETGKKFLGGFAGLAVSASPTACALRGCGRAGTQSDRLSEAVILSTGTPTPAQRTSRRRCRYRDASMSHHPVYASSQFSFFGKF